MLRNRVVSICVGFVFVACMNPGGARAQDAAAYMAQAIGNVTEVVRMISDKTTFGYDRNISLLGAYVRTGQSVMVNRDLIAGETYAFLGHGDRDVIDVDIDLFAPDGSRVAFDNKPETLAILEYAPRQSGRYTISLRLDRARTQWSFCTLAILRQGGWDVPAVNMIDAATRCIGKCQAAMNIKGNLGFVHQPNQWTMFGGVLDQGEAMSLRNLRLGTGPRVFVGAGDDHARDIDLFLTSAAYRSLIAQDDAPDTQPIFGCTTSEGDVYELQLKNQQSRGASLMFAAVLSR